MKFTWTTIKVRDMKESVDFYREVVGLEIDRTVETDQIYITFMGQGETKVELIESKNPIEINYTEDISMGFQIETLEKTKEVLRSHGISIHSGPFSPNPGMTFIYVLDPNGVKIQLIQEN